MISVTDLYTLSFATLWVQKQQHKLLYDRSAVHVQSAYLAEVISSLHVQLAGNQVMEVVLVQGVAATLQQIADQLITLKGVVTGRLQLLTAVMPPVCSPVGSVF